MPKGFYVKVSPYENFRTITNFFVKVSQSSWVSVSDAWVKVSSSSWQPFYSAGTEPVSPIEILTSFNSSEELRLQGVNYRWSPSPTTLQYRFRVVNKETPSSFYDLTSLTTTTNPSSGTSITLPSSSTYNTVTKSGGNYFQGATNVFQFLVRATTASGNIVEKKAEYEFRIPAAPTLSIETLTSTSVRLTINAASSADFNATYRYIIYRYDSTDGFVYGVSGGTNGLGGAGASTYTVTRDITGLTPGRQYTFYVMPITGSTGINTTTYSGYPGLTANIQNTPTSADPEAFTTISFTKALPNSSAQGVVRSTALSWNASTNATRYEIQYQARNNLTDAWTTVQTFSASPYDTDTSQSMQWGSPVPTGGFGYYYFMRAAIRASNPDSSVYAYSDGGTASNTIYIEASGTKPGNPTFGTITYPTTTSASVPFTVGSSGSNFLYTTMEYMVRTDSGSYPSTWSTTTYSNTSGTISLTTVAGTKYWVKMRIRNYDELYSDEVETSFTQPSPPTLQTGVKRSLNTGVTFTNSSTTMYISTNGYVAYSNNTPASISIPSSGTVLNIFGPNDLSQTNTSGTTVNVTYKNASSYFVIRWVGRYLGSSTETLEYEARFYWNSDLVEVNAITNNLSSTHYQSDNAVYSNGSATKTWAGNSSSISSWTLESGMANAGAPTASDDGYTAIVASKPVIKGTGTKRIIPLGITVTSGSTVAYVSTNGFIGLNSDPGTAIGVPSTGRYLNILQGDLRQTKLYTSATSTTYSIRYQGRQLSDANQTVDYEIKFTFGSTSAEVFIITNNLTSVVDDVLIVNGTTNNTWSGTNASTMTASASTAVTTNDEVDDARTAITLTAPATVLIPTNSTIPTLTGGLNVGDTFTFGVGTWNNSPTSYSLRLYRGTAGVVTSETLVKDAGNVTSSTYVIPLSDFTDTNNRKYYRSFATATNSAGTSGSPAGTYTPGQELGPITNTTTVTAPGTPTIGSVSGSGSVSWTAPTTGGAVASYEIEFYTASNGSGSNAAGPYTVTGIASSPYQLTSPYGGTNANWARARVRARNTGGASSYSAWAPSETTYA